MPNYQDLQDYRQQQNSLLMLNSILARKLAGDFDSFESFGTAIDLLDRPSFSSSDHRTSQAAAKAPSKESSKPKIDETPEVLARHGIHGKVSGFKGEFQCDKCPFRAEKVNFGFFHWLVLVLIHFLPTPGIPHGLPLEAAH